MGNFYIGGASAKKKKTVSYFFSPWNRWFLCHMFPSCLFLKELLYIISQVLFTLFGETVLTIAKAEFGISKL